MLDRPTIFAALEALEDELSGRGVRADVFVVGGAAMAIAYDARRATDDVDAVFVPAEVVRQAARSVSAKLAISREWLNDGVKAFLPGNDSRQEVVFERPHLAVAVASPHYLLAMKLLAARVERDQDDIRLLYELCGFTTAEQGLHLIEEAYPSYVIPPRTRFMLEEMYPGFRELS